MTVINLKVDDNYKKCEAIRKIGYDVKRTNYGCVLSCKKYKNLYQVMNVDYHNVNEVLLTLQDDLKLAGYSLAMV